jgi:hypothetical protein
MMLRYVLTCSLFLACALATEAADRTAPEKKEAGATAKQLVTRLSQRFSLEKGIDANTPLKDALEFIADGAGISIHVDKQAFATAGFQEVEAQPVRMPKILNCRLANVLRLLLSQVNAIYLVRDDYLEITPAPTVPGPEGAPVLDRSALPLVYGIFEKLPLEEALRVVSDQADVSVILDAYRAAEKQKIAVTATFKNVPVDTAVQLLADMAELKMVRLGNVFYVTTRENVEAMKPTREGRKPAKGAEKAVGPPGAPVPAKK